MRSSSGGVYQPTTTDISDHTSKSWSSGPRFLGPGGTTTGGRGWPRSFVLLLAALFGIMGLIMVIVGSKWHHEMTVAANSNATHTAGGHPPPPGGSLTPYVTVLVLGLAFMLAALLGLLASCRWLGVSLPCCPGKMANIRQRFSSHSKMSSHGPMSAQYCPPSAGPASPPSSSPSPSPADPPHAEPPFADVSEQQRLMSEESDRCAEEDPRIVLSPLRTPDC